MTETHRVEGPARASREPRILRDSAAAVPLVVLAGYAFGGVPLALDTLLAGVVVVLNLWVLSRLSSGFLGSIAAGGTGGLAGIFLAQKLVLTLAFVAVGLTVVAPLAIGLALTAMALGVLFSGLTLALSPVPIEGS